MIQRTARRLFVVLVVLGAIASTGCAEFVGGAARNSFAGFLTSVFATAVNSAVNE